MKYFAYGSNMFTPRLKRRVHSAVLLAIATLPGNDLRFHKRSKDNSSKCDAFKSDTERTAVNGVVFDIDPAEKPKLDRAEGLGHGYEERVALVHSPHGSHLVHLYVASPHAIDPTLRPYTWYRDLVLAGALEHTLPPDYVDRISAVEAIRDPNSDRDSEERAVLDALEGPV